MKYEKRRVTTINMIAIKRVSSLWPSRYWIVAINLLNLHSYNSIKWFWKNFTRNSKSTGTMQVVEIFIKISKGLHYIINQNNIEYYKKSKIISDSCLQILLLLSNNSCYIYVLISYSKYNIIKQKKVVWY